MYISIFSGARGQNHEKVLKTNSLLSAVKPGFHKGLLLGAASWAPCGWTSLLSGVDGATLSWGVGEGLERRHLPPCQHAVPGHQKGFGPSVFGHQTIQIWGSYFTSPLQMPSLQHRPDKGLPRGFWLEAGHGANCRTWGFIHLYSSGMPFICWSQLSCLKRYELLFWSETSKRSSIPINTSLSFQMNFSPLTREASYQAGHCSSNIPYASLFP